MIWTTSESDRSRLARDAGRRSKNRTTKQDFHAVALPITLPAKQQRGSRGACCNGLQWTAGPEESSAIENPRPRGRARRSSNRIENQPVQAVPDTALGSMLKAISAAARQEATDEREGILADYARRMNAARMGLNPHQLAAILRSLTADRAAALAIAGRNAAREAAAERQAAIESARISAGQGGRATASRTDKSMFRAAGRAVTHRPEKEKPKPRRRGRVETGAFGLAVCKLIPRAPRLPPEAYAAATVCLSGTLDWLNPYWQQDSGADEWLQFDTSQNQLSPHL